MELDIKKLTDEEIAFNIQKGQVEYFEELMERYQGKIVGYLNRLMRNQDDARDVSQDVFVKVFRNINSFDVSQRFSPWIYRIAHNEAVNNLKRRVREPLHFFDPELLFPHPVALEDPQSDVEKEEIKMALEKCLELVDEKYREVLVLRYFEDLDYKDISEILKIPVVTVGVRLNRGKNRLKKIYNEHYGQ